LATELRAASDSREAFEVFEVHWIALEEAIRRCERGEINDSKTCVGLMRAAAYLRNKT
jgi:hypothetical protein